MLQPSDLRTVVLTDAERAIADAYAGLASIGGTSQVRARGDRQSTLRDDQLVGQFGEMALSKYLGGTPLFYELTRTIRNQNPTAGDDGSDLLATNVDVKCSLMRGSSDPLRYRLLVRPRERHAHVVYVLALAAPDVAETGEITLVGWCTAADLPDEVARDGPFAGAYVLPATTLKPLPPIVFNWRWNYQGITCRNTG